MYATETDINTVSYVVVCMWAYFSLIFWHATFNVQIRCVCVWSTFSACSCVHLRFTETPNLYTVLSIILIWALQDDFHTQYSICKARKSTLTKTHWYTFFFSFHFSSLLDKCMASSSANLDKRALQMSNDSDLNSMREEYRFSVSFWFLNRTESSFCRHVCLSPWDLFQQNHRSIYIDDCGLKRKNTKFQFLTMSLKQINMNIHHALCHWRCECDWIA